MGLGKITRGLGKVGLALEAIRYIVLGGAAIVNAVRGRTVEEKEGSTGEDSDRADQTVDRP